MSNLSEFWPLLVHMMMILRILVRSVEFSFMLPRIPGRAMSLISLPRMQTAKEKASTSDSSSLRGETRKIGTLKIGATPRRTPSTITPRRTTSTIIPRTTNTITPRRTTSMTILRTTMRTISGMRNGRITKRPQQVKAGTTSSHQVTKAKTGIQSRPK